MPSFIAVSVNAVPAGSGSITVPENATSPDNSREHSCEAKTCIRFDQGKNGSPSKSGKNIGGNDLHSKQLTLRGNPGQIFLEISGFSRRVDVEPILYCPANPLIGQDFACADPHLVNYPG